MLKAITTILCLSQVIRDNLVLNYSPASGQIVSEWKPAISKDDPLGHELISVSDGNSLSNKGAQYKIEYSIDSVSWSTFSDKSANTKIAIPCYVDENKAKGRWVRLALMPTSAKEIAGIYEFKIFRSI